MIYDHIHNIHLYKGLSPALDTALEFIAGAQLPMDNETTLLAHGVKAIVSEYVTKPAGSPKQYEAHLKYADVQFLLAGSEHLRCPLEFLPLPLITTRPATAVFTMNLHLPLPGLLPSPSASAPATSPSFSPTSPTSPSSPSPSPRG